MTTTTTPEGPPATGPREDHPSPPRWEGAVPGEASGDGPTVAAATAVVTAAWLTAHGHLPDLPDLGPLAPVLTGAGAGLAVLRRSPVAATLLLLVLTALLTTRAQAGLTGPEQPEPVDAAVTLLSDPEPTPGGGIRAEGSVNGRRVGITAHRSPAAALRERLAGEVVLVRGDLEPPGRYEARRPHRHLSGRLQVELVSGWRPGHGTTRVANGLRRTLADGATSLSDRHQSLLAGLLLGDSRNHPPDLNAAFRDSGLAHLLVVSGANVALLLVVLGPVLDRMRLAPRLVSTLAALAFFALLTRSEPSVLRATAMAAVGAGATATGRPTSGLRRLALAVTGLLLIDPLLVTSLGFQLSSAGAAGIVVGTRRIADRLPGPRWLALPTAVTVASELAVAPLLAVTFGSVPLVSVVANLLAGPVAGAIKVWGLTAGMVAGLAGDPVASWLHLPTRVMLWWLDGVAATTAGLPVGELSLRHLIVLALGACLTTAGVRIVRTWPRLLLRTSGCLLAAGAVLTALLASGPGDGPEPGLTELAPGAELWAGGDSTVLVIDGRATEDGVLAGLYRVGVTRPHLLVVRTPANRTVETAATLTTRWPDVPVFAPSEVTQTPTAPLPTARTPEPGTILRFPDLTLTLTPDAANLTIDVELPPDKPP